MKLTEIKNFDWKINENLEVDKIRAYNVQKIEQELHINILAFGYNHPNKEEVHICCSIPRYINRLSRNASFLLDKVLISCGLPKGNDVVLQVTGVIQDSKLVSIKSQRRRINLSLEEKAKRAERLKKARLAKVS